MTNSPFHSVSIRADCGASIGYGHVMRCLSVADTLSRNGRTSTKFIMAAESDAKPVEDVGMEVCRLSVSGLGMDEIIAGNSAGDLLILDSYQVQEQDLEKLKTAGIRVAMFADGNTMEKYPCELVIDSAPAANSLPYRGLSETSFCLGSDYYPLREEFKKLPRRKVIEKTARKIVITFGGSDHDDVTVQALEALAYVDGDFEISAILGPAYVGQAEEVGRRDPRVQLLRNLPDIAPIMGSADIAISSSGGTASEMAYLGIPMVLMALSTDQIPVAQAMSKQGAAVYLGRSELVRTADITQAIIPLISDHARRTNMSEAGLRLIDGNGPKRIAEAIFSLFDKEICEKK
jgi:spore coat polysaccharide biosynthesis predicted glycosyltransferase SpsG